MKVKVVVVVVVDRTAVVEAVEIDVAVAVG
jgi:hypothetical protein